MSPGLPVRGGGDRRGGTFETDRQRGRTDPAPPKRARGRYLEWRDEWTLDVGFMDEDHRALAAMLSRIARDYGPPGARTGAPARRPDAPPLADALAELAAQTRAHFQREEEVMRVDDFPGLSGHKSEHDLLLAELSVMTRELRDSGAQWLGRDLLDGLKDWLLGHVLEMDRELAEFLKVPRPPEPV